MRATKLLRVKMLRLSFLLLAAAIACSMACGSSPQSGGQGATGSGSGGIPELTKEVIDQRINDARVFDVMPENGTGEPISWSFDEDEPKEIAIVDKQIDGAQATIILDIQTQSSPRARTQRHLAGQIRTNWKIETGWVLRRWEIVHTENISMKYKDVPKELPLNSNR
jgi:hypothetical protein